MLICVEEHVMDPVITAAVQPAIDREAPYRRLQSSANAAAGANTPQAVVDMRAATVMGTDLGESRLRDMDASGIDMQVISWSSAVQYLPDDQAVELTQGANDRLASAVAAHPDRFRGFATIPWQKPDAAIGELDRAVDELDLVGALLAGRPGTTFLDDPRYDDLLARFAELGVPIYLHPGVPHPQVQAVYYAGLPEAVTTEFSLGAWGWHHEAGIHAMRLILSGVFERHPRLQIISGHWGEMVPWNLARLDQVMPPALTGLSRTITETYRSHFWVTPSGIFDEAHFTFVRNTVGLDRILWSVDYPYISMPGTASFVDSLALDDTDREQITGENARRLFAI